MTTQSTELAINPQEFGIEEAKANDLIGNLPQIKAERDILSQQYSQVVVMDIEDEKTSKIARELRLKIRDNRTKGLQVWHKTTKDVFLKAGQFIDAIKRKEEAENVRMEDTLEQIEKHFEIKEQKRLDEIEAKRKEALEPFIEFVPFGVDIRTSSDEDFEKIFNGAKMQYEAKIEEEKKAEQERLENERLDKLEKERQLAIAPYLQFIGDDRFTLRTMSEKDFKYLIAECQDGKIQYEKEQEAIRLENEKLKKEAEEQEAKRQAEIEAEQKKQAKLKAEADAKLKAEQEAKAKLEAELKAKLEAEEKAEKERLAEIERKRIEAENLSKAPVKEQLNAWIDTFTFADKPSNEKADEIIQKFEAFKKWAKSEIEKL